MAFDSDQLGDDWVDTLLTFSAVAPTAGDETTMRNLWKALAADLKTQLANADVAPGTFKDSTSTPITGTGGPIT